MAPKKRGQGDGQIQLEKRFRGSSQLSQHDLHLHEIDWHRLTIPLVSANLWQFLGKKTKVLDGLSLFIMSFPIPMAMLGSPPFSNTPICWGLSCCTETWPGAKERVDDQKNEAKIHGGPGLAWQSGNLAIWQWKLAVSSDSYASYALFMVHVHCASYMFIKPWGTFHIPKLDCWREWFRWKIICWIRPTADQNWHCLVHHMGLSKRVCDHFDGWNMLKLWNGHFFRIWWP